MVVRAARNEAHAAFREFVRHGGGVFDDLTLILFEFGRERLFESDRFRRDDVHQRPALHSGEHRFVDGFGVLFFAHDDAAARPAKRFMRGCGDEIGVRHGRRMQSRRHESRDMGDIHHQIRADFIRDLAKAGEVDDARIRARARDDHFRLVFRGKAFQLVVINGFALFGNAVRDDLEIFSRNIDGTAVREVSAVRKIHAQNGIARLQHGKIHACIGVCAAVRLDVGMIAAEQLLDALARQVFHDVHVLTAAVIALAGQTFGIFIGQVAARRCHHRGGNEIFARDQLDIVPLAVEFLFHRLVHFGVGVSNGR